MKGIAHKEIHKNMGLRNILITVMNLDLWILISAGRFTTKLMKLTRSILEIVIAISLVVGLLAIYALPQLKLRLTTYNGEKLHGTIESSEAEPIGITDASNLDHDFDIERKINHLKNQAMSLEMAFRRMNSQMRTFHMRDRLKVEPADFAAEAAGGIVLETPNTESYYESKDDRLTLFGIPLCKPNFFTPRKVIQPWREAGECWAFRGNRGNVKIALAHAAFIDQVTLEHISITTSLTGKIDSAPREFRVTAVMTNGSMLSSGTFIYHQYGPISQTFQITEEEFTYIPVKIVILEIISNWGNPSYTCVYRFKVHGRIVS